MAECPCGSGEEYGSCCGRYIEEGVKAPTAEALMRSRYSAYVLKRAEYVVKTEMPAPSKAEIDAAMADREFLSLQIVDRSRGGVLDRKGIVEYRAIYSDGRREATLHERARFLKKRGAWLYDSTSSELVAEPATP